MRMHGNAEPNSAASHQVGWRLLASFGLGSLLAAGLSLGVFGGHDEHDITGALLLASGAGWAVLAARLRPLTWAWVPATSLGLSGLALVILRPDAPAMSILSWLWPPILFGLALWLGVQIGHSVPGRGRVLLTMALMPLALAAVGGAFERVSQTIDRGTYPPPGSVYVVNGHRLHLECQGHGSPTTLLFNGLGEASASWPQIMTQVRVEGRVCAYDRPGQGWSPPSDQPQDAIVAATDLHDLLDVAGESGPYILAGHSTGGVYALAYTARYPDQVGGVVLLDSSTPRQFDLPGYRDQYAMMRRGIALTPTLWRMGLGRLVTSLAPPALPGEAAARLAAVTSTPEAARNMHDELEVLPRVFDEAAGLSSLGSRPLVVVTASETARNTRGWSGEQARLSTLSTNSDRRTIRATHVGVLEDEEPAAQAGNAIIDVIAAHRDRTTVDPS